MLSPIQSTAESLAMNRKVPAFSLGVTLGLVPQPHFS